MASLVKFGFKHESMFDFYALFSRMCLKDKIVKRSDMNKNLAQYIYLNSNMCFPQLFSSIQQSTVKLTSRDKKFNTLKQAVGTSFQIQTVYFLNSWPPNS